MWNKVEVECWNLIFWQISKISQKYDILIGQVGKKRLISTVSHFEFNEEAHNH